jgi:hypothetical protein
MSSEKVIIVGAGVAGLSLAIMLAEQNIDSQVLEARQRFDGPTSGALTRRGWGGAWPGDGTLGRRGPRRHDRPAQRPRRRQRLSHLTTRGVTPACNGPRICESLRQARSNFAAIAVIPGAARPLCGGTCLSSESKTSVSDA